MSNWLEVVAGFLGCEASALNPNTIYTITCILVGIFVFSISYVLARSGRR